MIKDLKVFNGRIPQRLQHHLKAFLFNKSGKYGAKSRYSNSQWFFNGELVVQLVDDELHILGEPEYTNRPKNLLISYIIEYYLIAGGEQDNLIFSDYPSAFFWNSFMRQVCR